MISSQYLNLCDEILNFPSYDSRDELVAAGVKLYAALCEHLNSGTMETKFPVWKEIDDCKTKYSLIYGEMPQFSKELF